jgi:hypothetical protein
LDISFVSLLTLLSDKIIIAPFAMRFASSPHRY